MSKADDTKQSGVVSLGYLTATTAGMGFGLLTIVVASLCSILGPGLALRGSEGARSMHKAVDTMKDESINCFYTFIAQLFSFHVSSFLLMWVLYKPLVAICVNLVLFFWLALFVRNGMDIYNKLHVEE